MAGTTRKKSGIYLRGKTWWITYMDAEGKQHWESTGSKLKADADYLLSCRKKDVAEGIIPLALTKRKYATTFNELAEKYLVFCKPQKDIRTKTSRVTTLKLKFGDMKLTDISLEHLEKFQSARQVEARPPKKEGGMMLSPVKPVSVNKELATLKHMFTKAEEWGLVPVSSLNQVRKVKLTKVDNKRLRFLSVEEGRSLIDSCGNGLRQIVTFALNTGCRRGEIFALKWDNVDLNHGHIRIVESKNGETRNIAINQPLDILLKNNIPQVDIPGRKRSTGNLLVWESIDLDNRTVTVSTGTGEQSSTFQMNPPLVSLFREIEKLSHVVFIYPNNLSPVWQRIDLKQGRIIAMVEATGQIYKYAVTPELLEKLDKINRCLSSPYVFVNPDTGTRYQDVKKSFATACRKADIYDFHFHDLRHTFASQLVMAGVDLTTVSRLMGHKSLTMTLRYSHLAPNHLKRAVDQLPW
jgi:integrase